jgi:hypothetical protein
MNGKKRNAEVRDDQNLQATRKRKKGRQMKGLSRFEKKNGKEEEPDEENWKRGAKGW